MFLDDFFYFARFNTLCAYRTTRYFCATRPTKTHCMYVGVKPTLSFIVSVANVVTHLWAFIAYQTNICHNCNPKAEYAETDRPIR